MGAVIDAALCAGRRLWAKLLGAKPEPLDPIDPNRFCHTADGTWVDRQEVAARALISHVRRVVVNASGTVVDKGRKQRLFTVSARDAALFQSLRCYWKGCWIPSTKCQVDHLTAWTGDGLTNPGNGAPGCGSHNRLKELGYHAWRDPSGEWRIQRPDGSEVPDHTTHWRPDGDDDGLHRAA